ncbi:MAG: endonuclease/exonuclease/phosphatase family protein [Neomegalonema sp.]|nr:endonuclease/exonuclease/phosphatase family protein [Neomegalonema sp.]
MRIATFNVENLDDADPKKKHEARFEDRLEILRPQFERIKADILCLQEVHGQNVEGQPRQLRALQTLLAKTRYKDYQIRHTTLKGKPDAEAERNLVTLIRPDMKFLESREILHEYTPAPQYDMVTEDGDRAARPIKWDRPLFYCKVELQSGRILHVINAHFKSKIPTPIKGQGPDDYKWKTAAGWAEGYFVSSMKRVGAALEARVFIDTLFDQDPNAMIVMCGDLNADSDEVPVMALRGEVEETGNPALNGQILYPCESSVPEPARFTLFHRGKKTMLDHLLVSRALIASYRGAEIHNELVRDESIRFATDRKFPASDHAPVIAEFCDEMICDGTNIA